MIDAKTAHRLSEEQWQRARRDELETQLDAIGKRIQRAIGRGEWSAQTGLTVSEASVRLTDALVALGYTVHADRSRPANGVSISWGAPKERA